MFLDKQDPQELYRRICSARGEMESRLQEQLLGLFSDRATARRMRMNQIRIRFSAAGYWLMQLLREQGLKGTRMDRAQCWTIRALLLKGARPHPRRGRRVDLSFLDASSGGDVMVQVRADLSGFLPKTPLVPRRNGLRAVSVRGVPETACEADRPSALKQQRRQSVDAAVSTKRRTSFEKWEL